MQPYLNFKILNKIYFNLNKRCFVFPDYTIWCFFLKCSNCLSSFRIIKELKFGHLFHVLKVYIYHLCSQRSLKFKRRSCIRPVFIFSARNSQANQGVFLCKYLSWIFYWSYASYCMYFWTFYIVYILTYFVFTMTSNHVNFVLRF